MPTISPYSVSETCVSLASVDSLPLSEVLAELDPGELKMNETNAGNTANTTNTFANEFLCHSVTHLLFRIRRIRISPSPSMADYNFSYNIRFIRYLLFIASRDRLVIIFLPLFSVEKILRGGMSIITAVKLNQSSWVLFVLLRLSFRVWNVMK